MLIYGHRGYVKFPSQCQNICTMVSFPNAPFRQRAEPCFCSLEVALCGAFASWPSFHEDPFDPQCKFSPGCLSTFPTPEPQYQLHPISIPSIRMTLLLPLVCQWPALLQEESIRWFCQLHRIDAWVWTMTALSAFVDEREYQSTLSSPAGIRARDQHIYEELFQNLALSRLGSGSRRIHRHPANSLLQLT